MTPLLALRIYGPCSTSELSRHVGTDRYSVLLQAESLADQGLAERTSNGHWDVSDRGRAVIDSALRGQQRAQAWAGQATVATRRWPWQEGRPVP